MAGDWLESLPFQATGDQTRAIRTISAELAGSEPMGRLLMGEVGSGKTVVAIHAMLEAVASEAQAALMAPTEVLAGQHHSTLVSMLEGTGVEVALLTGSTPAADRKTLLEGLASGRIGIVVSIHSGRAAVGSS